MEIQNFGDRSFNRRTLSEGTNNFQVSLVKNLSLIQCSVWAGGFVLGNASPAAMYGLETYELFRRVADDGLNEDRSLIVTDKVGGIARFLYLVPFMDGQRFDETVIQFVQVLDTWAPEKLGVYLSPHLFRSKGDHHRFILQLLLALTDNNIVKEILMLALDHELNDLLSLALHFKQRYYAGDNEMLVFHY